MHYNKPKLNNHDAILSSSSSGSRLIMYDKNLKNNHVSSLEIRQSSWPANEHLWRFLKHYTFTHQARYLFILYGPLYKGRLTWNIMCENTAANYEQLKRCFGGLGWVFSNMLKCIDENVMESKHHIDKSMCKCIGNGFTYNKFCVNVDVSWQWKKVEDALVVFEEVISAPSEWLVENIACLLFSSDMNFMREFMLHKAVTGMYSDLTTSFTSLCLVLVKVQADLSQLLYLVDETIKFIPSSKNKAEFLDLLSKAFQEIIIDLYENEEVEERVDDFVIILKAQSDFCRILLKNLYEKEN